MDWVSELHLSCNYVNLSSELFLRKVEKLINFWAPLQKEKAEKLQAEKTTEQTMAN